MQASEHASLCAAKRSPQWGTILTRISPGERNFTHHNREDTMKFTVRTILIAAVAAAIVTAASSYAAHRTNREHRSCFPAKLWSTGTVPKEYRPCVEVTTIWEDGSFAYAVEDASGTIRYTAEVGAKDR